MSDIQEELGKRVIKCIKRKTGVDLGKPETITNLTIEAQALIQEYGFKCVLREINRITKAKFARWIDEEFNKINNNAQAVGERLIRFGSKVGDPVNVVTQHILLKSIVENLTEDRDIDELLSDRSAVLRFLLVAYIGELQSRVTINALQPLFFTVNLAELSLDKNVNWSTSMLALTIEEQFIKKKVKEFGIELDENEDYYTIIKKLATYFEDNNIRQSRELLLADSHRKIRNRVLHENWCPSEDETDDIIAHVFKLINFLNSELKPEKER